MRRSNFLVIRQIDGGEHRFDLPLWIDQTSSDEDDSRFQRIAAFIQEEYHARQVSWLQARQQEKLALSRALDRDSRAQVVRAARNRQANTPLPNTWLSDVCYRTIGACVEALDVSEIAEFFRRQITNKRRRLGNCEMGCTIFQLGINALFEPAKRSSRYFKPLCRRDREMIAKQLWHAYRHYVPVGFLEGFLLQCRNAGLPGRAKDNEIEDGFDHWIAANRHDRWNDRGSEIRGRYPPEIEKRARKLRKSGDDHPLSSRMHRIQ
jgi:hypothetical protein